MTGNWDASKHPRDDEGKFTFKNGGSVSNGQQSDEEKLKNRAELLYSSTHNKSSELNYYKNSLNNFNVKGLSGSDTFCEYSRIDNNNKENFSNKFTAPLEGKITNGFGYRKPPIPGASANHSGIDIAVPVGTPVKTIADGTVIAARKGMRGYDVAVFIDHGIIDGKHIISQYGHLSSYDVKVGDKVKKGQIIAKSGNTGISSGPHLHLTIQENGIPVNPNKYFSEY